MSVRDPSQLSRHALYVSALAGRGLGLRWHEEAHGLTYCDGAVIAVAAVRGESAWLDLSLQALLVRHGSLSAHSMQRLVARPGLARAYLACELARAVSQLHAWLPRSVLEHEALARLPPATKSRVASLERARELTLTETPAAWGLLVPLKVLARRAPASTESGLDQDDALDDGSSPTPAPPQSQARDERELEDSAILNAFSAPTAASVGMFGKLLASLFDRERAERATAAGGGGGGETQTSDGAWLGTRRPRRAVAGHANLAETAAPLASTLEVSYPEWDEARGRYRPDFVRVAEVEPDTEALLEATPPARDAHALRRTLARLALGYEPRSHQQQGDELDLDALVRLSADLASGHAADPRIYRGPTRTKRDLSALVMLDITGSTAEPSSDGARVFDRQLDFALSLTQALFASGGRTALSAFHSWGAKIVRVVRLLDFGERPGAALIERARRVSPVGYSRLGAAIRHGARVLDERARTPYRLLIVISDALAYDQGYEGRYAHADTRRALAEARGDNIACVCLSIGASADAPELERVFGGSCFLSLPTLHGNELTLRRLFERALAEVTRQARDTRRI